MMEFIYKKGTLNKETLAQGDVIERTAAVDGCFESAHPFGPNASDHTHLVVVTQSCDLVKNRMKAPYITLAAAKPFSAAMEGYLEREEKSIAGSNFSYYPRKTRDQAIQLVERFLHNTESDFFFLPEAGHSNVPTDLVVTLRLTVALDKKHYEVLANDKIIELADVFRAKLGWLVGDIYSRVATPALEEFEPNASEIKNIFYDKYVRKNDAHWLTSLEAKRLGVVVTEMRRMREEDLSHDEVKEIFKNGPKHPQIVAEKILNRLKGTKLVEKSNLELMDEISKAVVAELKSMN